MMQRKILLIVTQISLGVAIGLFTELAASTINIDTRYVWGILIILLIFLVPTTWMQLYDKGDAVNPTVPKIKIPDQIIIPIPLVRKNLGHFLRFSLNAVLLGIIVGYVGVIATNISIVRYVFGGLADQLSGFGVYIVEVIGGCFIPLVSYFVMRRRSLITGVVFCSISSVCFSLTHLSLISTQNFSLTIIGNLVMFVLIALLLRFIIPLVVNPLVEFWR